MESLFTLERGNTTARFIARLALCNKTVDRDFRQRPIHTEGFPLSLFSGHSAQPRLGSYERHLQRRIYRSLMFNALCSQRCSCKRANRLKRNSLSTLSTAYVIACSNIGMLQTQYASAQSMVCTLCLTLRKNA